MITAFESNISQKLILFKENIDQELAGQEIIFEIFDIELQTIKFLIKNYNNEMKSNFIKQIIKLIFEVIQFDPNSTAFRDEDDED